MLCKYCKKGHIELLECREIRGSVLIWIYECPECHEQAMARRAEFSPAPIVNWLKPRAEDDSPLPGRVVTNQEDPIRDNPARDHECFTVYWTN